jgi:hypothetical protein
MDIVPGKPLPTFLILGAYKSGTTSLHFYLKQHPDVFMSRIKEIRYLTYAGHQEAPLTTAEIDSLFWPIRSLQDYEALFAGSEASVARGDVSPCYFSFPEQTILGIKRLVPDAKLVLILRHPVERAYSSYCYHVRLGYEEVMDFRKVFRLEAEGRPRRADGRQRTDFLRCFYAAALQCYFDAFPRERFFIRLYDDLVDDPGRFMRELFAFIGVDDSFVPDFEVRHNVSQWPRIPGVPGLYRAVNRIMGALQRYQPRVHHAIRATGLLEYRFKKTPPMDPGFRQELVEYYRSDILRTQELIGRDLSGWLR